MPQSHFHDSVLREEKAKKPGLIFCKEWDLYAKSIKERKRKRGRYRLTERDWTPGMDINFSNLDHSRGHGHAIIQSADRLPCLLQRGGKAVEVQGLDCDSITGSCGFMAQGKGRADSHRRPDNRQ